MTSVWQSDAPGLDLEADALYGVTFIFRNVKNESAGLDVRLAEPKGYAVKYLARSSRVSVRERFANEKLSTEVCGSVDDDPEPWVCADMDMIDFVALQAVHLLCACLFATWLLSSPCQSSRVITNSSEWIIRLRRAIHQSGRLIGPRPLARG